MTVRRLLAILAVVLFASFSTAPAWADATYPPVGPSPSVTVKGEKVVKPVTSGSSLPFTGADIAAVTVAGLALIAAGTVAITAGRRRRGEHQ